MWHCAESAKVLIRSCRSLSILYRFSLYRSNAQNLSPQIDTEFCCHMILDFGCFQSTDNYPSRCQIYSFEVTNLTYKVYPALVRNMVNVMEKYKHSNQ
ncbi:hypothetical protein TNIN_410011 [Trichonephila inaurata madagascariensis]|uniref:Uncharacterized protein n=1 Tax=Trichonephila inaurata madagascariensis TaxID=2747483 RepID=A0A8X6WPW9_9ARAC|nr:hypothetical protein TNIN_410011 [Trichonephila inaurata madagascariensis]